MSRFFYHILTDPGDGDVEFDTSVSVGNLSIDINGSPSGLSTVQVNDGYYFDYTISGLYTIAISAADQVEFTNIPLVADEDNVTTQNLQSVDGYIYYSGGYLRVYTDGGSKNLHAGDVVNNDTAGGTDVPASAEIAKTLGAEIDTLVNNLGDATAIDVAKYRHVLGESRLAALTSGQSTAIPSVWVEQGTQQKVGGDVEFFPTDTKIHIRCQLKAAAGGTAQIVLYISDQDIVYSSTITSTSWTNVTLDAPIQNVSSGIYKVDVGLIGNGSLNASMQQVSVMVK